MRNRRILNVVFLSIGLALCLSTAAALAQNQAPEPTAQELFSAGLKQYTDGDFAGAKETLMRVDPIQLPKEDRVTLYETLQDLDRRTVKPVTAAELMAQADAAHKSGDHAKAASLYQAVEAHADATPQQKQVAHAHAAECRRQMNGQVTSVKQQIDRAAVDLRTGALDQAQAKLQAVKDSGLDLGWFDNARVDRLMQRLTEQRTELARIAAAAQPKPEPQPEPQPKPEPQPQPQPKPEPQPQPKPEPQPQPQPQPAQDDVLAQARTIYVQEKLAEGAQAEQNNQYRVAVKAYQDALKIDPENNETKAMLAAAQAKLNQAVAPRDLLETTLEAQGLRTQATVAEFRELMNRADGLLKQKNFPASTEAVQQAKIILDRNRRFLPQTLYKELRDQSNSLSSDIDKQRSETEQLTIKQVEQTRSIEAAERRLQAERETRDEVQRLLRRAADLRRVQQYDKALELLDQALFLDPTNVAAQALVEIIEDTKVFVQARDAFRARAQQSAKQTVDNIKATIPYADVMTYPSDWPQITAVRLGSLEQGGGESEVNRRTSLRLREPVPVNFEANKLSNVIDYLRNTTGVNFFVNWAALEAAGVQQDTSVTLQLTNIPAEQALKLVLMQAGAAASNVEPIGFSIIEGIVTISTQNDLKRTTETRVYDIRDLLVQVPNFTGAPEFDLNQALSNTNSGGSSSAQGVARASTGLFGQNAPEQQEVTREEQIEQITSLIQDTVGRQDEWAAYGGDTSSLRELNGNLIVKSTPENHRQVLQLLGQLRETRAIQIHIEARFLLVDQNFLEEVGFDVDAQWNDLGTKFGPIRFAQDSISMAGRSGGGLPGSFGKPIDTNPIGPFTPTEGFAPGGRALDFNVSYLDDLQVNLIIRATKANRRSISLTAPRVTLFNGQRSNVIIARQITFVSDLEPIPGAIGFDPTLSVTQSGVVLDVEATVSADRRYVTMTARPSLATVLQPIRTIPQSSAAVTGLGGVGGIGGAGGIGGVGTASGFIEAPELELTSVRTSVSVPDKGTLLMGGQRLVSDIEVEAGIPILSQIPIINRLFTNRSTVKDERTLLILIKPTIMIQNEQEEELFPGLLENPQQYNIGREINSRQGIGSR